MEDTINPQQIMSVILALIMIVISIYVVGVIVTTQSDAGAGPYFDQTYPVSNSSQDQTLYTGQKGMSGITVYQWNGVDWVSVSTTYWTYDTNKGTITVDADGLY